MVIDLRGKEQQKKKEKKKRKKKFNVNFGGDQLFGERVRIGRSIMPIIFSKTWKITKNTIVINIIILLYFFAKKIQNS